MQSQVGGGEDALSGGEGRRVWGGGGGGAGGCLWNLQTLPRHLLLAIYLQPMPVLNLRAGGQAGG